MTRCHRCWSSSTHVDREQKFLIGCQNLLPMDAIIVALSGFWLMLPAFLPNSAAVLFGGGRPIDFGRSWHGKRILGDGKTWTGLIGGITAGTALGYHPDDDRARRWRQDQDFWGFGSLPRRVRHRPGPGGRVRCWAIWPARSSRGGWASGRGAKAPILDQYNFIGGALIAVDHVLPLLVHVIIHRRTSILALLTVLIVTPHPASLASTSSATRRV